MSNKDNTLAKFLFSDRTRQIIGALGEEALSTKEIAQKIGEAPLNLYRTINKLLEYNIIKVEKEVRVNNMIEKYYSSAIKMNNGTLAFEGEYLIENYNLLIKAIMLEINQAIYQLQNDVETYQANPDKEPKTNAVFSFDQKKLSHKRWMELNEQIRNFIDNYEDDPDGDTYRFVVTGYKE